MFHPWPRSRLSSRVFTVLSLGRISLVVWLVVMDDIEIASLNDLKAIPNTDLNKFVVGNQYN